MIYKKSDLAKGAKQIRNWTLKLFEILKVLNESECQNAHLYTSTQWGIENEYTQNVNEVSILSSKNYPENKTLHVLMFPNCLPHIDSIVCNTNCLSYTEQNTEHRCLFLYMCSIPIGWNSLSLYFHLFSVLQRLRVRLIPAYSQNIFCVSHEYFFF